MLHFFKPGDKVRIRKDLEEGKEYGGVPCIKAMIMFCLGKEDKIRYRIKSKGFSFKGSYRLERMPFFWSEEMLELIDDEKE